MSCFHLSERPSLIGVIHLLPLPGSPTAGPTYNEVLKRVEQDAIALRDGGVDGIILENYGDAPFVKNCVEPTTIAFMTRIALDIKAIAPSTPLGINVLRNDAAAALAVAAATHATFIRINVHTGTMVTDQGLITGQARNTLLQMQRYSLTTKIAADVHVKHANPLGPESLVQAAKDTIYRGHANALIITGSGTGQPVDAEQLQSLREQMPKVPLWIGSGLNPDNVRHYKKLFHTAIVGTYLHENSDILKPIDPKRVSLMRQSLDL